MTSRALEGSQLSPQQRRVWSLQQASSSQAFHAYSTCLIEGNIDLYIFEAALRLVLERNSALRTVMHLFPEMNLPVQVLSSEAAADWSCDDLTMLTAGQQEVRLRETIASLTRPFDFQVGPLLRLSLLKTMTTRHILIASVPVLIGDGEALANVMREICRSYSALVRGERPGDDGIQYPVVSEWQNELLEADETRAGRAYWKKVCNGASFNPSLPLEDRVVSNPVFEPQVFRRSVSAELQQVIEAAIAKGETSPFVFLLSCWVALLSRTMRTPDIAVGVAFNGRTDEELEEFVGLLAKYLPIRRQSIEGQSLSELFSAIEESTHEASDWQECFAWELVEEAPPENRIRDRFAFGFEFLTQPAAFAAADFSLTVCEQYACIEPFKIKLSCAYAGPSLTLDFHFDSSVVSRQEVSLIAGRYLKLIERVSENPHTRISQIDVLSDEERLQILAGFNDTSQVFEDGGCLHDMFVRQVERTPASVAVAYGNERITYKELNKRANQLAHYLRRKGVYCDTPVGLCVERSIEMVTGMLGILKAGGGYVTMDPANPDERLAAMQQDASAKIIVCQQRLSSKLELGSAELIPIDGDWDQIARESEEDPPDIAHASSLAYLIYTSGSTGKPKAVMITHGAIVNHMNWMKEEFPLDRSDRVLQKTPFSFDASVWEFYAPLLSGAELVMAKPGGHQDARYLVDAINRHEITVLQVVPTLLRALLEEAQVSECRSLRRVFSGGEALGVELQRKFEQVLSASLHNLYGPTEATIDSTFWTCENNSDLETVPIGRPIANTRIYILDDDLRAVPIGLPGDMFIAGEGLARGYYGKPALTAEKFIPDPYSLRGGERLYRTGDKARFLADGRIDYLGRVDHQVKIRGYRIELGEIERVIEQHKAVKEAAVLSREENGERALVMYVVTTPRASLTSMELQEYLRQKLPPYMVPAKCAMLEKFPVTPSGKTDRAALLALELEDATSKADGLVARTQVEEMLAAMWQQLLKVERVGRLDNFFELGGHSLLATQVISRIREFFQVELSLETLFNKPRLNELAQCVEDELRAGSGLQSAPIERAPRDGPLRLSFAQQRLWFVHQLYPDSPAYNLPTAFRIQGPLKLAALEASLNEIVRRHEVLRTTFATQDEMPAQVIASEQKVELLNLDFTEWPESDREAEAKRIVTDEARRPFDLTTGPLLRATAILMGKEDHIVVLTLHHIVFDNWSSGVLVKEMGILYEAFSTDLPSPLPELPIQYADFAAWQRDWLQGEVLDSQLSYWKKKLTGYRPLTKLPADHARPSTTTFNGRERMAVLSEAVMRSLKALGNQEGATLFMTLLAGFKTLLYRYTGQDDLLIGCPIANRNRSETEGLIGFFINNLMLRTDLSGNPSFKELLGRIRGVTLGAFAHQDVPFEKIVEELQPHRDLSHTPLSRVMFSLQNAPTSALNLPQIKLTPYVADKGTTILDLFLAITETNQGLIARLSYNCDLFESETIDEMLAQYSLILENVALNPDLRLLNIPLSAQIREQAGDRAGVVEAKYGVEQFNFHTSFSE